jgi:[protein-PII] uridylyltransferase
VAFASEESLRSADVLGAPGDPSPPSAPMSALRRLLKTETERLRIRHRFGRSGREVAAARSDLVDVVVGRACGLAAADCAPGLPVGQDELAVVALGGYGRRELAPFSDVEILFLHADEAGPEVHDVIDGALALLSEAGLSVRPRALPVAECVALAGIDLRARTAMVEARMVAGSPRLFALLAERLDGLVFASARTTLTFLDALRRDLDERYARYGRAVGLLEPHVKEGAGGLRDLHSVLWVGQALFGVRGLARLSDCGALTEAEHRALARASDFIQRIRNEAHFATGRKTDVLDLELQAILAENLGYRKRRGMRASEILMREYYERADELHRISRAFHLRHAPGPRPPLSPGARRRRPRGLFEIREGRLHSRGEGGLDGARHLLDAFAIAQRDGPPLSDELKLEIRARLRLVDRRFRGSREAGRGLLRLLGHKGQVGSALRGMHETGLLGRLLPEFARVRFLAQHDFYQRHTVDEHTLTAIDALDAVASPGPVRELERLREVMEEVAQPGALYLAVLLHDVGKGRGPGHVRRAATIAERVCARLGLEAGLGADVVFLADAHLEMSRLSQRRDLREAGVTEEFARRVSTVDRLNMLLLLTYADQRAIGPRVWNEWTASLLWDLYERTRAHLTPSAWPGESADGARERAVRQLEAEYPPSEVQRHFALVPDRYLRATEAADIVRHFRLLARLEDAPLVAEWHASAQATDLAVATRDHPGLFAQLAGTLTAEGLDILSVDVYTREDGIALDLFKVRALPGPGPVPPERRAAIEEALRAAVAGGVDVAAAVEKRCARAPRHHRRHRPAPPRVVFDGASSAARTVIEVRAADEPGLAFRIASVLTANGLDIAFAKITTDKSQALDVFYVTGGAGGPLSPEETVRVEGALRAALAPRRAHSKEEG